MDHSRAADVFENGEKSKVFPYRMCIPLKLVPSPSSISIKVWGTGTLTIEHALS